MPETTNNSCNLTGCAAAPAGNGELASVTIASKIPEFWTEMPRVWFAQFETVMAPQKQGDGSKYSLVVSKLGKEAIRQVSDILIAPPEDNKYGVLKQRLLSVYEESEERQFQKLVSEIELGDQKPSHLLRRMKELAKNTSVPDKTLVNLWTSRLPSHIRAVLTVSQDQSLDNLAGIADKIMENSSRSDLCEVSSEQPLLMTELLAQVSKLTLEVAALRAQSNHRGRNSRSPNRFRNHPRYPSRSRSRPRSDELCWYHINYKQRAYRCEQPCNWGKTSASSEN